MWHRRCWHAVKGTRGYRDLCRDGVCRWRLSGSDCCSLKETIAHVRNIMRITYKVENIIICMNTQILVYCSYENNISYSPPAYSSSSSSSASSSFDCVDTRWHTGKHATHALHQLRTFRFVSRMFASKIDARTHVNDAIDVAVMCSLLLMLNFIRCCMFFAVWVCCVCVEFSKFQS